MPKSQQNEKQAGAVAEKHALLLCHESAICMQKRDSIHPPALKQKAKLRQNIEADPASTSKTAKTVVMTQNKAI